MMKSFCALVMTGFCLFFSSFLSANAQSTSPAIEGAVLNEKSETLAGVSVTLSQPTGFRRTTQTATDGRFRFAGVPAGTYSLQFSYVGYTSKTIDGNNFDGQQTLSLSATTLEVSAGTVAEEVVVVGYGRSSRRDLTSAAKSVKSAEFNRGIINSPEDLLQGKVSGVQITSASGEPGAIQNITVRGPGGVRTGNTPLYVVDGLALDNSSSGGATNPLSFINPQDIESIDVLKDASATAIYGTRGANGVILITTKKGRAGSSSVAYSFNYGVSQIARALPVFSADEYKRQVAALGNALQDFGGSTDWQDEITRTAITQNHNIALSGGADKLTYYGSFGMQLQEGILKNNDLKRYTGRMNVTQRLLNDRLIFDANLSASNVVNTRPDIGGLIGTALSTNPTIPALDSTGNPFRFQNGINPLTLLQLEKDVTTTNRILGNLTGSLTVVKGLVYRINFGVDNSTATRDLQSLPNTVPLRLGRLVTLNNYNRNYLIENYLTYTGVAGDHRYTALAGHSYQKIFLQGRTTSINTFPVGGVDPIFNPGTGQDLTLVNNRPTGFAQINELQSFFGRINYGFRQKYLITAILRADGSSKFGANNRYGYFPAFSGAWVLSQEEFLRNSIFSNLKLRAGWGKTGNQEIEPKRTQALFSATVTGTTSYPLYANGPYPAGVTYVRLANPNIQWESSAQTDLGIDFELFRGKLAGTVDYFRKVTNNILLLVPPSDPIQPARDVYNNVEEMTITNKGVEIDLKYQHISRDGFSYSIGGNVTFIENVVKNSPYTVLPSGSASGSGLTSATINGYVNGEPIGTFFLQEFVGFTPAGLSQYNDVNKDGLTNDKDRIALGSALPTKTFNVYATAGFKGFDLAANFNGVSGNKIYDNTANAGFYKGLIAKGVNTTAEAVASPQESINNAAPVSSRYLKDGRYFRFNNLSIGYNFNVRNMGIGKWISALRLSATGQNLFVITPYDGYDPEVNTDRTIDSVLSYGIDYLSYPKSRNFLVGLNVTF